MPSRIVSISGIRGVVGDGLDPQFLVEFGCALGTLIDGGTVVLSRDGRSSGHMIRHAVLAGLTATGCRVLDAGVAPTPTCGVLVTDLKADAGLQITASHNPAEWNGLKPFGPDGAVFDEQQGARLLELLEARRFRLVRWGELGEVEALTDVAGPHVDRVLSLVDVEAIRRRRFRVVLDCNHGAGAVGGPALLEQLGCDLHVVGGVSDGRFEHPPEPLEQNLRKLCQIVRERQADVGFALDPDADRLALIDHTGRYVGEELTIALCADYVLARRPGPLVVNSSSSRVGEDVAKRHGCPFYRSRVGERHVVTKMREVSASLGGEGNGGVIEPKVGWVRDSLVGMAYVLAGMAESGRSLAEWVDTLPRYSIVKQKLVCSREKATAACEALQAAFPDAQADLDDGLRLDWPDRWVQVRASNTEPIVRVVAEAPTPEQARQLCQQALQVVRKAVGEDGAG